MAACMPRRGRWRVAGHRSPRQRALRPSVGLAWPESVGLALGQKGNGGGSGVVTPKEFHPPSFLPFENDSEDGDSRV